MDLKTYLNQPEKTQQGLADALNVSQGLIGQWLRGETNITPERAIQIEAATDGVVRCEDLLPDLDWRRDRRKQVTGYFVEVQGGHQRGQTRAAA